MNLKLFLLNFLFPDFIVELNKVQDGVDQFPDVGVLITQELKYDIDDLGLVEDNVTCGLEHEEFEVGVEDLLNHFIIFLLGPEEIMEHTNEVGTGDQLCTFLIPAESTYKHD